MTYHCSDLGSASDWLKQISRSLLIRHFAGKPVVGVAKCRPFSRFYDLQAISMHLCISYLKTNLSCQQAVSWMWKGCPLSLFYSACNHGRISSVERALVIQLMQSGKWAFRTQELRLKTKKQGTTCTPQTLGETLACLMSDFLKNGGIVSL